MRFITAASRWLLITMVSGFMLILPLCIALRTEFAQPNNIKQALRNNDVYTTFVDAVLDQSAAQQGNDSSSNQALLQDPGVRSAVRQAFPASLQQSNTEQALDNTYAWLQGKVPSLAFSLDLGSAKSQLVASLASYASDKAKQLPICTNDQLRAFKFSQSVLDMQCLPPGMNTKVVGEQFAASLVQTSGLLANPVINSDTILKNVSATQRQQLNTAPRVFGLIMNSVWFVLAAIGVCAVIFTVLNQDRSRALARLGWLGITTGVFILAGAALYVVVAHRLPQIQGDIASQPFQASLNKTALQLAADCNRITAYVGGGYIGLGSVMAIVFRHKKPLSTSDTTHKQKGTA